ncbi:MAG: hypothetical protein KDH96_02450 [Candidatus Riesia sp.]|nr:hypothetical protein [Candidatus Riesia sp.]
MNEVPRIKVDDIEYVISDLPTNIQEMVQRYELWTHDELKAKLEMEKASLARTQLNTMIIDEVRKNNASIVKQMKSKPTSEEHEATDDGATNK